ncbi:MAG: YobA family protein [Exiguobacterium sp.]|uniref:DUF3221 domain-containing protein n=1 Tax=Exiguobacterium sp. s131 TaxID=2751278 RepID=UPI001BE9E715|nr:DUF3221 domain-containing protein [Exiguobacterium sp. s131]MDX5322815.1 YobA family protein [Exiguobacterium sp.]MDX5424561.1 YobA family protein [Exiguobacterium sp.]MDX6772058.1 YobA family protein [Exiguobacterium sp.]
MKSSLKIMLFLTIAAMLVVFSIGFVFANRATTEPDVEGYVIEINESDRTALVISGITAEEATLSPDTLFAQSEPEDVSWFKFQVKATFKQITVGDHVHIWKKTGPSILNTPNRSYVKKIDVID